MEGEGDSAIWRRYAARIWTFGLLRLRDAASADDLVQQVMVAVLEALREGRVEDPERLDSYVFGTCRNMVMHTWRARRRGKRIAEQAAALPSETWQPPSALQDRQRLERCLDGLEPRDRSVVLATFVEDRGADEIGESMGLSPGNVRVIRHRALAKLQDCLQARAS
jgi:RNA polymerase sigma-70 factor (ECF subfamily)